jgi:SAM-dependent methyltransferase
VLLPDHARVLDVGCGDGRISQSIADRCPGVEVRGIDVLVRPGTHVPVDPFDGKTIPHPNKSFDVVMFVDVLHHTDDPMILLREGARVARRYIILKDHTVKGLLAAPTLRFMDRVGNLKHGVDVPYNYWSEEQWRSAFADLHCAVDHWNAELGLYPAPASWWFDRSLHFVARLTA